MKYIFVYFYVSFLKMIDAFITKYKSNYIIKSISGLLKNNKQESLNAQDINDRTSLMYAIELGFLINPNSYDELANAAIKSFEMNSFQRDELKKKTYTNFNFNNFSKNLLNEIKK